MKSHPQLNEVNPSGEIICINCLTWKNPDQFNVSNRSKRKRQAWCRLCHQSYSAKKYESLTAKDRAALNARRRQNYDPKRTAEYRRQNYEAVRAMERRAEFKNRYGITPEHYDAMCEAQQGRCPICQRIDLMLVVDHDHQTGRVRALLCGDCNRGIGHFFEKPDRLRAAADWVESQRLKDLHT